MVLLLTLLLANPAILAEIDGLATHGADHARELDGVKIVEGALAEAPADYELLWRASRANFFAGRSAPQKERLMYYQRGIDIGKRAVAANPGSVEGHFWLGASYGGYCEEKGGLTAFRSVKYVRAEMDSVIRINDAYEDASAYTALGEIDWQLPGLFGGNVKRAIATLERGLKVAPHNPELKLALANSYLEVKRKEDALAQLREVVQWEFNSPRAFVERRAQEKARALLTKTEKK